MFRPMITYVDILEVDVQNVRKMVEIEIVACLSFGI